MTLNQEAAEQKWGPTIFEPRDIKDAIEYALQVLGSRDRAASLGEIYGLKGLQWALRKLQNDQSHTHRRNPDAEGAT